jgi:membrane fusion protein, multidrug efflux system
VRTKLLLLLVVLVMSPLAGCKKPEASAELTSAQKEVPLKVGATTPVIEEAMPEYLVLTGTLRASQETELASVNPGRVAQTLVERGQHVNRGDTVAILDSRSAAITANAMSAQSNLATAQLEQARKECERVKALKESGAISQAEYDRVTSQCQTTQWSAAAAQAQQQSAQKVVGDAAIRAPFSGVIGERYVNVGQYVQPGMRIVSLYEPDPLRLELTVPEANIGGLKPDMPVTFNVSAHGDQTFSGAVKFISPNVRPQTRDLVIEAFCPNPDGKLKPGMFAIARLETGEKKMMAIPHTAVKKDSTSSRAYAVVEKRVQERLVQTAGEREGLVGIVAGLKPGEVVITQPGPDVRDGATVQ